MKCIVASRPCVGVRVIDRVLSERCLLSAGDTIEVHADAADISLGRRPRLDLIPHGWRFLLNREIGNHSLVLVRFSCVNLNGSMSAKSVFASDCGGHMLRKNVDAGYVWGRGRRRSLLVRGGRAGG